MNLFAEALASPLTDRHSVRVMRRMWASVLMVLLCSSVVAATTAPAGATTRSPASGSATARAGASGVASVTMTPDRFEYRLRVLTNAHRERIGCRALRLNAALLLAARRHSALMSAQDDLSHRLAGEPDLVGRAVSAGYTSWRILAENLAWGQATPRAVFRDWMHSPGHRANLDNCRLRDVGYGVVIRNGRPWVTGDYGRHS
jgi:uncharacterized protein YkwD